MPRPDPGPFTRTTDDQPRRSSPPTGMNTPGRPQTSPHTSAFKLERSHLRQAQREPSPLETAGGLVLQLGNELALLPEREAFGCGTNPLYSVVDAQVPEPDRAIGAAAGQRVPGLGSRQAVTADAQVTHSPRRLNRIMLPAGHTAATARQQAGQAVTPRTRAEPSGRHAISAANRGGICRQRGPSVAVRETADGAHRPSWRPGRRPLYVRGHRDASTHGDTS
jgi:hypothetical protein